MKQPINIIGAGAVGETLAVFLQQENRDIILIRGRSDGNATDCKPITVQLRTGELITQLLAITTLDRIEKLKGTVVITAKSYANEYLANLLQHKAAGATIVLLQNGLGVEQPFLGKGFDSVMRCVLFLSSQYSAENYIRFKPVRPSPVGVIDGNTEHLTQVVEQLNTSLFPFMEEKDIQPVVWKKAIINCVFNSICPLLESEMGIFHREKEVLDMGIEVIKEGIQIATLKGITLLQEEVVEQLLQISRASDGQFISTMQDMLAKRPTEIETLNLAIAKMGSELDRADLVQTNALLGRLIRWKSNIGRNAFTKSEN